MSRIIRAVAFATRNPAMLEYIGEDPNVIEGMMIVEKLGGVMHYGKLELPELQQIQIIEPVASSYATITTTVEPADNYSLEVQEIITEEFAQTLDSNMPVDDNGVPTPVEVLVLPPPAAPEPNVPWMQVMHNIDLFWQTMSVMPSTFLEYLNKLATCSPGYALKPQSNLYTLIRSIHDPLTLQQIREVYALYIAVHGIILPHFPPFLSSRIPNLPKPYDRPAAVHLIHQAASNPRLKFCLTQIGDKFVRQSASRIQVPEGVPKRPVVEFLVSNKFMASQSACLDLRYMIDIPHHSLSKLDSDLFEAYVGALLILEHDKTVSVMDQYYQSVSRLVVPFARELQNRELATVLVTTMTGIRHSKNLQKQSKWQRTPEELEKYVAGCLNIHTAGLT